MDIEKAWLAGIIEGEASIGPTYQKPKGRYKGGRTNSVRICVQMCDEDIVQRVAKIWGSSYRKVKRHAGSKPQHRPQYACEICGPRSAALIDEIWELLGDRRREQIDAVRNWQA